MIIACHRCDRRHDVAGRPPGTIARCQCGARVDYPDIDTTATALGCPNCGAAASPDLPACDFCGSHLAQVRCPACFALAFDGARHCHVCGGVIDRPALAARDDGDATMPCPRCDEPLIANLIGDTVLDDCLSCGGLWMNRKAFEDVVGDRHRNRDLIRSVAALPPPSAGARPAESAGRFYIDCPECAELMDRRQFGKGSGIVLDVCAAHGVWCDAGELTRVIDYVEDGGMAQTAQKRARWIDQRAKMRSTNPAATRYDSFASAPWTGVLLIWAAEQLVRLLLRRFDL